MSNTVTYQENTFGIGDTVAVNYRIQEGEKFRNQTFEGIIIKVRGVDATNRMITVRKMSRAGIGVERIIPLSSPFISGIKLTKKSTFRKSRLYFIRDISQKKLRNRLYKAK